MSDTPVKKGILNSIHAAVKWVLHEILIPVVWIVELLIKLLESLLTQLQKI